ncbi:hypothetical protein HID58_025023 [Brassica napus]|uniref:Uncharacterized protein n=1 Tax=Brassica napus TaxID=3708 RepID=A0ABQ8CLA0_BRANA|nr:hypothetical protein HID58_025023 [Brassica napus]
MWPWPAFRYQGAELKKALVNFQEWSIVVVLSGANRFAQAIAKNVTREKRFQYYVAMGWSFMLRARGSFYFGGYFKK